MLAGVLGNAFPQQPEHKQITMLPVDASATQFHNLAASRFKDAKAEFLFAIVTQVTGCTRTRLEAVSPDNLPGGNMFHEQVIANGVKGVGIQTRHMGVRQPLVQLQVKNLETQRLRRLYFLRQPRAPDGIL
jgi:hypothetical protein